jgi:hypothetical protein
VVFSWFVRTQQREEIEPSLKNRFLEETYPPNQICRACFGGRKSATRISKSDSKQDAKPGIRYRLLEKEDLQRWILLREGALTCTAQKVAQNVPVAA